jgi:hypothetical protein
MPSNPTPAPKFKTGIKVQDKARGFDGLLDNISDLYDSDELEQIRLAYEQMQALGSGKQKAVLVRKIEPIRSWVESNYFLGPDAESVYPFWKEKLIEVFERPVDQRINQIILTGAIGTGKSTFAVMAIIRVIYELSCYKHIASLFKLFGVSRIAFAYLSVTKTQAQSTGFALLVEWLDSIPYFREMFKRRPGIDSMIIWPQERLIVTFGSVANHFIGMNLIGSVLDEANFFSGRSREESDFKMNSKIAELYTQIITRSESRFIINGVNHSLSILVSSSTVESSFTEEQIEKTKDDVHTYVVAPALWHVKPENYCGDLFYVYVGGDSVDPFVIDDLSDFNMLLENKKLTKITDNLKMSDAYLMLPSEIKSKIIEVPIEHKKSFNGDIIIALQDLAGYSVSSANRLFTSEAVYNKSVINTKHVHPFSSPEITLSTTKEPLQEGYLPIKAYLTNGIEFDKSRQPHFIHLDLALTGDSAGIAMTHINGFKSIYKQESNFEKLGPNDTGLIEDEIRIPTVAVDFMLKINPPKKPNKISLGKIRDFIVYLRNELRINIALVTADQFQSAQLLQELDELGFETANLSVDRTATPYLSFTNLLYEERVSMYHYEPFKTELFHVIYYPARNKVDHPKTGSKDVADSVVGASFSAIQSEDKTDVGDDSLVSLFIGVNKPSPGEDYEDVVKNTLKGLEKILRGDF